VLAAKCRRTPFSSIRATVNSLIKSNACAVRPECATAHEKKSDVRELFEDHCALSEMSPDNDTIVSFAAEPALRDLLIGESGMDTALNHQLDHQLFHIRMANTPGTRKSAGLLLQKMYGWRGYEVDTHDRHAPNRITLYAEAEGATVGTMSMCLDDAGVGLPADENFRDKLDDLRSRGHRLCEPSRLAIDRHVSKRVFASLIHISYIYAHNIHGYTDYIIEVNPRHVMFYKRMLGFKDFGGERHCSRVQAPAVLLRLELEYMGRQIDKFGGMMEQREGERSFYPYFFAREDEPGITARLMEGKD